jgi:uncharacterized membrane protein YfcA
MTDRLPQSLLITGTFILAGLVKGVTGLGLPTVSMGLLGLAMSPVQAAGELLLRGLT